VKHTDERDDGLQEADAILDPNEVITIDKEDAAKRSLEAFEDVFKYGPKIELDHYLVYHAREFFSVARYRQRSSLSTLVCRLRDGSVVSLRGEGGGGEYPV
jgi:hypothetical protein